MADSTLPRGTRPTSPVALLGDIATCLFGRDTTEEVVRDVFARIAAYLDLDLFLHYVATEDHAHLRLAASAGVEDAHARSIATLRFGDGICGTTAARRKPIVAERLQDCADPMSEAAREIGARAYACHPLLAAHGQLLGTVSFGSRRHDTFNAADLELLSAVANYVAVAIDRMRALSRLEDELEERRQIEDERRRAQEALRASEEKFAKAFHGNAAGMAITRLHDGTILDANNSLARMCGYDRGDLAGRSMNEIWKQREDRDGAIARLLEAGGVENLEARYVRKNGEEWIGLASAQMILLDGEPAIISSVLDITDRKRNEAALKRERAFLRTVIDSASSMIVVRDDAGRCLLANEAAARFHGMTVQALQGRDCRDVPTMPPAVLELDREALRAGRETTSEVETAGADGLRHFLMTSRTPLLDPDGVRNRVLASSVDLTWLKRAEHALRESEDRLRLVIDSTEIGVFDFYPQSGRLVWSDDAKRHFGLPPHAEVTYEMFIGGLHPDDRERVQRMVQDVLRPGSGGEYATEYRAIGIRDGRERWLSARGRAFFDEDQRPVRFIGVTIDITERKRAEADLRSALDRLAEADRRKDEFIAILSHELRNPLAPIRYAVPVLRQEDLGEGASRALQVIDRQVGHLTRLVDDLLDVSRITRGKIELRREHVTLGSIVNAAVEAASPAITAARHTVQMAVPEEPIWLHADAARIAQVITNLLNNSAKYTPRGGRITLEAAQQGDHAVIRVQDNGVGIPSDALAGIFDMFRQVEAPQRGSREENRGPDLSQGGLGIGLALVKRLVEMHGGTIEARSAGPGQGAEFIVRLPVAAETTRGEPIDPGPDEPAATRRLRVLIVDDNADLVEMLAIVVSAAGHDVRKALDGRSAISAAASYRPDVVLLDLGLPIVGGLDVARELRRRPETAKAHLVALTGWGQADDRRQTQEAGFDDHLTKPTEPQRLQELLAEVARGGKR